MATRLVVLTSKEASGPLEPSPDSPSSPSEQVDGLFRSHASSLKGRVRRFLGHEQDADDAVQDAFLRIWQKAQQGALRREASSYLFQAALNAARDLVRRRRTEADYFIFGVDAAQSADPAVQADRQLAARQTMAALQNSLLELEEFTRTIFLLYHLERLTVPAIALKVGKTTRTVERHLAAALAHCAARVGPLTAR